MFFISFIKKIFLYLNHTLLHSSNCQSTFRAVLKPLGSTLALLTITRSSLVRLLRNFAQIFKPTSFMIHTKQIFNISIWRCSITQFVCKMTNFILSITPVSLACSLSNFAQICRTMSYCLIFSQIIMKFCTNLQANVLYNPY